MRQYNEGHPLPSRSRQLAVISAIILLTIGIVGLTSAVIIYNLNRAQQDVGESVYFVIERDESVDSIADRLAEQGLIRSPAYFRLNIRLTGKGNDIVAGRYRLDTAMSTRQIINTITSRDAALAQEVAVQFIEGWRTEQIAEHLVSVGLIESTEEFLKATRDPRWNDQFPFLHSRPSGVALEGYLFPDTYNFRMDSTPDDIIQRMLANFGNRVTPQMIAQADARGLTLHQVITIASIVEREAVNPEERPTIASVYLNRINRGMPLQADPTVQYQIGTPAEWWPELSLADLQRDGRYNTYLNPSLPPGPICNPSLASIEAVLNPDTTDYLYFVATGDGSHVFSRTLAEHEENVRRYQSGQ
jgi:UPF0755 protein